MKDLRETADHLRPALDLIIAWYSASRRILPWREDPTPYHTWIAEIMLQQTRIEAVIPYYRRFLSELPDISSLAAVPEDRLLKLWEGLGYYSRARNLKKAALIVTERCGGELPASAEELRKLPGIGDYTAGAIASIAFGLPEPAVDGNVLRVMMRLLSCGDDISLPATRRTVTDLLRREYPSGESAGLLTEGIMELGETVCLPNALPRCEICPVRSLCAAHQVGEEVSYPVKSEKKPRRIEERTVFLLRHGGRFAIRRRSGKGLLAGLWEFPNTDGKLSLQNVSELLSVQPEKSPAGSQNAHPPDGEEATFPTRELRIQPCGDNRHIFTHVEWHMTGYLIDCDELPEVLLPTAFPDCIWKTPCEIEESYSLPTAFRYYQNRLSESV